MCYCAALWCFFQSWKLSSALAHHLHWLPGHWKHVLGAILYKHTLLQRRAPQAHSTQQQELRGLWAARCPTSSSREQMCKQTDVSAPGRPRASKASWTQAREEQIHYKEARMLKALPKCKAKSQPGAGSNYLAAEKHWKQRWSKDCAAFP